MGYILYTSTLATPEATRGTSREKLEHEEGHPERNLSMYYVLDPLKAGDDIENFVVCNIQSPIYSLFKVIPTTKSMIISSTYHIWKWNMITANIWFCFDCDGMGSAGSEHY